MLQMINPGLGELKLTLECCGEAQPLADVAMNKINLNQYTEPIEEKVKRDFVGKGKCSALEAKQANVTKGKAKCTYLYDYADKNWQKYKYSAYCVPSDVLSNFAGPQSTIMGYVTVPQTRRRKTAGTERMMGRPPPRGPRSSICIIGRICVAFLHWR
eukprot:g15242.t1